MEYLNRILEGEPVRDVLIESETSLCEMAKLVDKLANLSVTGDIPKFIYFSQSLLGHGPRIKFYGGTKLTGTTQKAPTYSFGVNGPEKLILQPWMNPSNCPNGFDNKVLTLVKEFIEKHLALLLLTWFEKLDEAYLLHYFEGFISFADLLSFIDCGDSSIEEKLQKCRDEKELHELCKKLNLYQFS